MQVGSVVRLKSGGPLMTIAGREMSGAFICQWFVNDELKRGSFSSESLEDESDEA